MKLYSAMMILLIKGSAERSFTHLPQRFSHCFVCGLYLERRPTSQHKGIIKGGIKGKQKIITNLHSACCIHLDNQVWFFNLPTDQKSHWAVRLKAIVLYPCTFVSWNGAVRSMLRCGDHANHGHLLTFYTKGSWNWIPCSFFDVNIIYISSLQK